MFSRFYWDLTLRLLASLLLIVVSLAPLQSSVISPSFFLVLSSSAEDYLQTQTPSPRPFLQFAYVL